METEKESRYQQELSRSVGVLGNIAITVSAVTPASSVFIIVPFIVLTAGTGSFLALVFAAVIGVFMSFCWAELSARYPIAGGDYALVWHAFKGRAARLGGPYSFVTFALLGSQIAFIPAVIALGTAQYLGAVWTTDTEVTAAVVMLTCAAMAILNIRLNARVTGVFLVIELLALAILTVLGLINLDVDRFGHLFSGWQVGGAGGGLDPVTLGTVLTATSIAVFAYNGYQGAVLFSEETRGHSRNIAVAIMWSLAITVVAELVPTTAVLLGTPDVAATTTSATPMSDFIVATSNVTLNKIVSIGIAIAIINAVIAIVLQFGRILYSSGRDRAWGPLSPLVCAVHPRLRTPWIATAFIGILGAVLCLTVSLNDLIVLTGASLVANYALVALAAIVGRATGATSDSPYRMPLWPLPPLAAIAALGYVATQQTAKALWVTGVTMLIGLVYWALVIYPQRGRAWDLKDPVLDRVE